MARVRFRVLKKTIGYLLCFLFLCCMVFFISKKNHDSTIDFIYDEIKAKYETSLILNFSNPQNPAWNKVTKSHLIINEEYHKYGKSNFQNKIKQRNDWIRITNGHYWRYPTHLLGYLKKLTYDLNEKLEVFYAGDLLSKSHYLKGYAIYDVHTNQVLKKKFYVDEGSFRPKLVRQYCFSFYRIGCDYREKIDIDTIGLNYGEYYILLEDELSFQSLPIYFSIRPKKDNSADVVVMYPNFTWAAYNREGGGSFYARLVDFKIEFPERLVSVSLNRPSYYILNSQDALHHSPAPSNVAAQLLRKNNIQTRMISNTDLHLYPDILHGAKVLVLMSHEEYWTLPMRKAVDAFLQRGGSVANFSGDLAQWIVNFNEQENSLHLAQDGLPKEKHNEYPQFVGTGLTDNSDIHYPVSKTFGVSYQFGIYPVKDLSEEKAFSLGLPKGVYKTSGAIHILEPKHPIFSGLNFSKGDVWNTKKKVDILHDEIDGAPMTEEGQLDGRFIHLFPKDIQLLAWGYIQASNEDGMIKPRAVVVDSLPFDGGGRVLSFSSIGYGYALFGRDAGAEKIFLNSINYLLGKNQPEHRNFFNPQIDALKEG